MKIECKLDKGSDSNLMALDIFKILFPKATLEQLVKYKDKGVTCNKSKITLICSRTIRNKNKANFFQLFCSTQYVVWYY